MRDASLRPAIVIAAAVLLIAAAGGLAWWLSRPPAETVPGQRPEAERPRGETEKSPVKEDAAQNLAVPWALDFLPDGGLIFTERPGNVKLIRRSGERPVLLGRIDRVAAEGESGLLGLAVHPDYAANRFIYVYYTYRAGGRLLNRVVRYRLQDSELEEDKVAVDRIPGAVNHDGGRIKFGPDGLLYITTGDSLQPNLAQDEESLAGKILRVEDDGGIPGGNPFPGSPVYSLGHRNPQGLAWDDRGRLWATEHGPSGNDEVNLIEPGKNYGWPVIEGDEGRPGLEKPVVHSNGDTWAPSGAAWLDGRLFFAGLRGEALFSLQTRAPGVPGRMFADEFGRLRDTVIGPDGWLYVSTSNRDGRGDPGPADDRIIRIDPDRL